jgi:hypothetical protein
MGAMDAELLIVDAFLREQARHDKLVPAQVSNDDMKSTRVASPE